MKQQLLISLFALGASCTLGSRALASASVPDPDRLKVVTTLPDLADIVREIGGDRVDVMSIYRGKENTHAMTAKPSHLVAMSRADLFFEVGLSLEVSVVPGLLENCRNPKIQPGSAGFVNISEGWEALDVPASLSRKGGDVHPQGNPHMNLDPRAGQWIADKVVAALSSVDPGSKAAYESRYADYTKQLVEASARWAALSRDWAGQKIVVYHQEYNYLAAAYALKIVGAIELKPGIPPTPNHIAELVDTMKREGAKVILSAVWSNGGNVQQVAEEAGAQVIEVPNMCGGLPGTDTWIGMMDVLHQKLQAAFAARTVKD